MFQTRRQLVYTPEQLDQFLNEAALEGRQIVAYREFYRPFYNPLYGWFYAIEVWVTTVPVQVKALPEHTDGCKFHQS